MSDGKQHQVVIHALVCGPPLREDAHPYSDTHIDMLARAVAEYVTFTGGRANYLYWHDAPMFGDGRHNGSSVAIQAVCRKLLVEDREVMRRLMYVMTCEHRRMLEQLPIIRISPRTQTTVSRLLRHPEMAAMRVHVASAIERLAIQTARGARTNHDQSAAVIFVASEFPSVETTIPDGTCPTLESGDVLTWTLNVTMPHRQVLQKQPLSGPLASWQHVTVLEQLGISTMVEWKKYEIRRVTVPVISAA